jgi:hypothetical protein
MKSIAVPLMLAISTITVAWPDWQQFKATASASNQREFGIRKKQKKGKTDSLELLNTQKSGLPYA